MIYITEVKTVAGVYFRFYETVKTTKKTEVVQAVKIKPYNKLSDTEFQIEPDLGNHFGSEFTIQKNSTGLYIESSTKKGLQRTYLVSYDPNKKYVNIFDKSKFKGAA